MVNKQDVLKALDIKEEDTLNKMYRTNPYDNELDELKKNLNKQLLKTVIKYKGNKYNITKTNYGNFEIAGKNLDKLDKLQGEFYDDSNKNRRSKRAEFRKVRQDILLYGVSDDILNMIKNL